MLSFKSVFFKLGVARDFKFWSFRDYDDFGRKVAKYKINSKRRPFCLEQCSSNWGSREILNFGVLEITMILEEK